MKFRRRSAVATLILLGTSAFLASAQNPPANRLVPPSAQAQPPAPVPIVTVGSRSVARDEFRAREAQAMSEYRQRLGQEVPEEVKPVVRRQLLESLIRRELLILEAARRGVLGTEAEAEALLRREPFFNPDGKFDSQRFEAVKTTQPENYTRAIQAIRTQLGAQKLGERLEQEYAVSSTALKTTAERSMGRASVDLLALRRAEVDGVHREPRESEVLEAYRKNAEQYRKPAEARLTVLLVDQPPLADGVDSGSPEANAWRTRMKQRADSALAAARGGASFQDLAHEVGSVRNDVVVTSDNFPGFWRGDAKEQQAVFTSRPGSLLASPVVGQRGWLVVRVEDVKPAGIAPLAEVARQVRGALRADARLHGEDRELREAYEAQKASLRTTAWKIRWAAFDTSASTPDPSAAELDRWYRAHQADFSSFDAAAGQIRVRPLSEVRDVATERWKIERRRESARIAATALTESWKKRARDRNLEKGVSVREAGPLISGAPIGDDAAARTLADTLARRPWELRAAMVPYRSGWVVYHVYESVPNYQPSFEQARAGLRAPFDLKRREADENAAKALYEKDPGQFAAKNVIYYTRLIIPRPDPIGVPLTRAQVERYHRSHIDRYSAPEQVRARHILVSPVGTGPDGMEKAREKAQGLLDRAKRGEDFADLARRYSDDVATKEKGGDLGDFGRGAMLPVIEDVAFRLEPGKLSDPIPSEVGWHLLQGVSRVPLTAQDLRYIYANVGWDAALEMADSLVARRADSLSVAIKTPAQGRAAFTKIKTGTLDATYHEIGDRRGPAEIVSFYIRLENTKVGQVVPGRGFDRATGHFVAWVDSIAPARQRDWQAARPAVIDAYRRGGSQRALDRKTAELDSLMAQGWSADSIAALWGGWERIPDAQPGTGLGGLGGSEVTDSLVFGTPRHPAVLKEKQLSGWVELPGGMARVRLQSRSAADASRVAATVENEKRIQVEQRMLAYFEDLKKRFPVRILDERLRDTPLPPAPTSRLGSK